MKNNQKGITLIALVITIIVLLILAGISIAMLTGENGILGRAKDAGANSKVAEAKEQVGLAINDLVSEYYELKYVNNDNISGSVGDYVDAGLAAKITDYATYTSNTVTLISKDADGKTVSAEFDTTTGKLGQWTATTPE